MLLQEFYASSFWTTATSNGNPIQVNAIAVSGVDSMFTIYLTKRNNYNALLTIPKTGFSDADLLELANGDANTVYRVNTWEDLNSTYTRLFLESSKIMLTNETTALTDQLAVRLVNADCTVPIPSQCPFDCLPGGKLQST